MKVSFELTMPNVGSWNGKWTGEDRKYFVIRSFSGNRAKEVSEILKSKSNGYFYYNFGDGWGAGVMAMVVDANEAKKRLKQSAGFCGYEWMIDSILKHGKIQST